MALMLLQEMGTLACDLCPFGSWRTGCYIYVFFLLLFSLNKTLNKADKEALFEGQTREMLCTALITYLGSSQERICSQFILPGSIKHSLKCYNNGFTQGTATFVVRACMKPSHGWFKAEIMHCHPVGPAQGCCCRTYFVLWSSSGGRGRINMGMTLYRIWS